jgi:DNA primase
MEKKRFSSEDIDRAKKTNLREYLGIGQRNILSPFRDEAKASFSIFRHSSGNWIGKDHGGRKEPYDSIAIVQKIENKSFVEAVKSLLSFNEKQLKTGQEATEIAEAIPNYAPAQNNSPEWLQKASGKEKNIRYEWLQDNKEAIDYLVNVRNINFEVVEKIADKIKLVNVVIEKNDRTFKNRMVAFPNQSGGWACRNINPNSPVKEHIAGPSGLTIMGNSNSSNVFIFESCIDALSYLSLNPESNDMLISLNSASNYKKLSELQLQGKTIYLCLDNDKPGWDAVAKIKETLSAYDYADVCDLRQQHGNEKYTTAEKEAFHDKAYINTKEMQALKEQNAKDINDILNVKKSSVEWLKQSGNREDIKKAEVLEMLGCDNISELRNMSKYAIAAALTNDLSSDRREWDRNTFLSLGKKSRKILDVVISDDDIDIEIESIMTMINEDYHMQIKNPAPGM